jgi:hypothetical protein
MPKCVRCEGKYCEMSVEDKTLCRNCYAELNP